MVMALFDILNCSWTSNKTRPKIPQLDGLVEKYKGQNKTLYSKIIRIMVTITISGTPGSGKSTVAKLLEGKLGVKYIYSGMIFRELA